MNIDVAIVGAGIIGCAIADACAARGMRVHVIESGVVGGGVTAAGMGHLVVLDDNPAELALSLDGVRRWQELQTVLPIKAAYHRCGTLWLAKDEAEFIEAGNKARRYGQYGHQANLLDARQLAAIEPMLASDLYGALQVTDEAVVYAPCAAQFLLRRHAGITLQMARAEKIADGEILLADGERIRASAVVVAAGYATRHLVSDAPISARKGHLLITDRYPGEVKHQLVELGYIKSAHAGSAESVAFNVQPRPTGQLLIGSSRQQDIDSNDIDWPIMQKMLNRAFEYLPGLQHLQAIRIWTGIRPTTPDNTPLLGRIPDRKRSWIAAGHEGLGVTTALSSAALLASLIADARPDIDPAPFAPDRFNQINTKAGEIA